MTERAKSPRPPRIIRSDRAPEGIRTMLLDLLGDQVAEVGKDVLLETPWRVFRAMSEMTAGYALDAEEILAKRFPVTGADQMVVVRDISFVSLCEHHLLPFAGVAHLGYLPQDEVVGLSKLARLVECFARRLQLQERITLQVVTAMMTELKPVGAGAILVASHGCMSCRGVKQSGSSTVTSHLEGRFRDAEVRAEFLRLAGI